MVMLSAEDGGGPIAARIDRLPDSGLHRRLMLFFALPLFFDGCNINTFPSAAPALIHAWGMLINQVAFITLPASSACSSARRWAAWFRTGLGGAGRC